jgi:hypothetical protein
MVTEREFNAFVKEHGAVVVDGQNYLALDTARMSLEWPLIRDPEPPGTLAHHRLRVRYLTILRDKAGRAYTTAANELRSNLELCQQRGCQIWFDVKAERERVLTLKIKLSLAETELRRLLKPQRVTKSADEQEAEAARDKYREVASAALASCSDVLGD